MFREKIIIKTEINQEWGTQGWNSLEEGGVREKAPRTTRAGRAGGGVLCPVQGAGTSDRHEKFARKKKVEGWGRRNEKKPGPEHTEKKREYWAYNTCV